MCCRPERRNCSGSASAGSGSAEQSAKPEGFQKRAHARCPGRQKQVQTCVSCFVCRAATSPDCRAHCAMGLGVQKCSAQQHAPVSHATCICTMLPRTWDAMKGCALRCARDRPLCGDGQQRFVWAFWSLCVDDLGREQDLQARGTCQTAPTLARPPLARRSIPSGTDTNTQIAYRGTTF